MANRHNSHDFSIGENEDQTLVKAIIEQDELPLPKGSHAKILQLFDNENSSSKEISTAIQANPVLTTKIIGAANSAAYAAAGKSNSLADAIMKLGIFRIRQIVFGLSLIDSSRKERSDSSFDYADYWKHSLAIAVLCEELGKKQDFKFQQGDLFTAGLLSQIAWLALAGTFPKRIDELLNLVAEDISLRDASRKLFIIPVAHVSAHLLHKIGMPAWIANSVGLHENEIAEPMDDRVEATTDILRKASSLAKNIQPFPFSLASETKEDIASETISEWKTWCGLVGI